MSRRITFYKAGFFLVAAGIGVSVAAATTNWAGPLVVVAVAFFAAAFGSYGAAARGPGGPTAVAFANLTKMYRAASVTVGWRDSEKSRKTMSEWIAIAQEHGYAPSGELAVQHTLFGSLVRLTLAKGSDAGPDGS